MTGVTARAPAKLNLYLHVLGKRADGYHELESLVAFTGLTDTLEASPHTALSLAIDGEFAAEAGDGEGNLVLKAARLLQSVTGTNHGAALHLTKHIPVGAGLGGGSADAAATLHALNELWALGLDNAALHTIATTLGADVAMCLTSKPAIARGVGEVITLLPHGLPELHLMLAHPRTPLLTPDVFWALDVSTLPAHTSLADGLLTAPTPTADILLDRLKHQTRNDLQRAAISVRAEVGNVLLAMETMLPTAPLVRMSGSGACCFALYTTHDDAEKAADGLRRDCPHWWVKTTTIISH